MSNRNAKRAAETAKKHPKLFTAITVILVIIIVAAVILWYFKPEVFDFLLGKDEDISGQTPDAPPSGAQSEIAEAGFSIHFLELGNKSCGDSILIDCGDTEVLIDAGSQQSSAEVIQEYIDKYCDDGILEYVITTHADTDHISAFVGTAGVEGILYHYSIGTLIKFDRSDKTTEIYSNYLAAVAHAEANGTKVYTAGQCYEQTGGAQRQYYLDEEQTLSINILYNKYYYESAANTEGEENNYSVVTLLTKELPDGDKHFLFTGDLELEGEEALVEYYKSVPADKRTKYNILPEVELYKAGHHGSKTSSNEVLMDVIKPKAVAVCCVAGSTQYTVESLNTFPTQAMIDHVGKYTDKIYVTSLATGLSEFKNGKFASRFFGGYTSMNGTIVFYWSADGLKLWCSNNDTILKDTEWFKQYRTWKY